MAIALNNINFKTANQVASGLIFVLADSLGGNGISLSGTSPAYTAYIHQRGVINWFQALTGFVLETSVLYRGITPADGSYGGIGGEFTRQMLARLAAQGIGMNPAMIMSFGGTNDIKNDYTAETVVANIQLEYRMSIAAGIPFYQWSIFPRNDRTGIAFSAPQEAQRLLANAELRKMAARLPNFILLDAEPILIDPATGLLNSAYEYDGLHINSNGAYQLAKNVLLPKWVEINGSLGYRAIPGAYNATTNPYGDRLTNSDFVGTAGTASTGVSGSVPTSWRAERSAGTQITAVSSIVTGADFNGTTRNEWQLAITSDGSTADTETLRFRESGGDFTTNIVVGGLYEVEVEVEFDAATNDALRSVYFELSDQSTGGMGVRMFSSRYTSGSVKDIWPRDALKVVYRSPPLFLRGTTGLRLYGYADMDGTVAGSRTIRIIKPILKPILELPFRYDERERDTLLFVLRSADMQSTADRIFRKVFRGTKYIVTDVRAERETGGATVACTGGIYTAASKGGSALVAASQSWLGLSGASKTVKATLASVCDTDIQTATPYLSLTTGSTAACTADIKIYGKVAD